MIVRRVVNAVLSVLIAPPCAACGNVLDEPLDGAVCAACWRAVAAAATPASWEGSRSLSRLDAIGPYEGRLRDVIHALKYDGRRSIAPRLARLMAGHAPGALAGANLVVPVPLHRRRLRDRGFNQADDLACGLGLPVCRGVRRTRITRPQVELPAADRQVNVRGAFAPARASPIRALAAFTPRAAPAIRDRVIVLVDDVTTTGATLEACAEVLLASGAREVRGLTAARVATGRR